MEPQTPHSRSKSFLLPMYARLFQWLRNISIFTIVRRAVPDNSYHSFVDLYILAHLALSVVCLTTLTTSQSILVTVLLLYGGWRCFELVVVHLNQILFDEYRVLRDDLPVDPLNYRRLVLIIIHNYVELIFWFAFFYRQLASHFSNEKLLREAWTALYLSVVTQATVGYGDIIPADWFGRALVVAQISVGVFLVIAVLARWLSIMRDTQRRDKIT